MVIIILANPTLGQCANVHADHPDIAALNPNFHAMIHTTDLFRTITLITKVRRLHCHLSRLLRDPKRFYALDSRLVTSWNSPHFSSKYKPLSAGVEEYRIYECPQGDTEKWTLRVFFNQDQQWACHPSCPGSERLAYPCCPVASCRRMRSSLRGCREWAFERKVSAIRLHSL